MQFLIPNIFDEAQIRLATSDDLDEILAVQKSAPEAAQWSREVYASMFALQGKAEGGLERKLFCAVRSQIVVGFVVVAILLLGEYSHAELENMAVAPDWRRRGVGRRLIEAALDCCREVQNRMILEVRKSNIGAIRLYESKGFTKVGLRGKYYSDPEEDALRMEWESENKT